MHDSGRSCIIVIHNYNVIKKLKLSMYNVYIQIIICVMCT